MGDSYMKNELNDIIQLTKDHVKVAAITIAKAFMEYPVAVFMVPDKAKRTKHKPAVSRQILRVGIATGEVYATSARMEGVAVWIRVAGGVQDKTRWQTIRQWFSALFADKELHKRQQAFFEYSHAVRARVVPEKYWYLQMLGVDPVYQGQGFSSKLLKPMLARADREGLPCFLETQVAKNVTLYEHFGFRVVEEGVIPGSNVHSWAMVREAKSG
jgi:GNAT superfamily N-acetyltransferase